MPGHVFRPNQSWAIASFLVEPEAQPVSYSVTYPQFKAFPSGRYLRHRGELQGGSAVVRSGIDVSHHPRDGLGLAHQALRPASCSRDPAVSRSGSRRPRLVAFHLLPSIGPTWRIPASSTGVSSNPRRSARHQCGDPGDRDLLNQHPTGCRARPGQCRGRRRWPSTGEPAGNFLCVTKGGGTGPNRYQRNGLRRTGEA